MASLYDMALTVPWCITPPALEAMLSIAAREPLPEDEITQRLHGPKSLALRDSTRRDDSRRMTIRERVALIPIDGPIHRYADFFTAVSGGVTTDSLAKDLQRALDDPAVQAIAFVIDSPGGEATGINELADAIFAARGRKPMAAYIEGYGASAAYWIASAADVIVADDEALVGSIGTVIGVPDPTKRPKFTIDFVSSQSPKKRMDPTTEIGQVGFQQLVDDMTEVFIAKVMRNRNLTRPQVLAVEGGLVLGQQAINAGLADRLGSEEQVIRDLVTLATRPATAWQRPYQQERTAMDKGFWTNMFGGLFRAAQEEGAPLAAAAPVSEPLAAVTAPLMLDVPGTIEQAAGPDPREARLAELERQLATQQQQQRDVQAAAFADGAVRSHRALPAERPALYDAYLRASCDDAAAPLTNGSRAALLEGLVNQRIPHSLTQELIAQQVQGTILPTDASATPELSEQRRRALLAMTPTGQAVLAAERAGRRN